MTLGVRAVVENTDGQVLLVRHTYTKGLFPPGGGVERGETLVYSLHRELEEDGGVRVTGMVSLVGIYSNHRIMRNDHVALYKVEADAWSSFRDPIGNEISEVVWCDPRSPPDDATPGTKRRFEELYFGIEPAQHW